MVTLDLQQNSTHYLLSFRFPNYLTEHDAKTVIGQWKQLFEKYQDKPFILIWECSEMKDYDSAARVRWQECMRELKNRFELVYLVSASKIVKAGAVLMSTFSPYTLKNVNSLAEIPEFRTSHG